MGGYVCVGTIFYSIAETMTIAIDSRGVPVKRCALPAYRCFAVAKTEVIFLMMILYNNLCKIVLVSH